MKRIAALMVSGFAAFLFACTAPQQRSSRVDKLTYHGAPQRTGWNPHESILTPQAVAGPSFGRLWRTPQFDSFGAVPPRLFASPLYVDRVSMGGSGSRAFSVLYAVTTTGYVYAVNAFEAPGTPAGAILWHSRLTERPCGKGNFGNLSTPVIDLKAQRLYVTSCDEEAQWRAHALDIRNGERIAGWPVSIDHIAVNVSGINRNGMTQFPQKLINMQRGALNLSPSGTRLYVAFGLDMASGWIVGLDTRLARVATAFSTTAATEEYQGGMWASGGPSVDAEGNIHIATGASSVLTDSGSGLDGVFSDSAHSWGQSVLQLADDPIGGFSLRGVYTPFNYCEAAAADIDLGSGGTVVVDLPANSTATPRLLLAGGKQGNVYLINRSPMPGNLEKRPACSSDSSTDRSLFSTDVQPQFGQPGPVNVFGPYSDRYGMMDHAKSRTTAAYFRDARDNHFVFVTGSAKEAEDKATGVPPGIARLRIVTSSGRSAYLKIDRLEMTQTFLNPGSPVVSSNGGDDAVVWVLDQNAPKTTSLYGPDAPQPILYAFDASTLKLLWKSAAGELGTSGKYNEPTVARGTVFVGTDRIEAYGLRDRSVEQPSAVSGNEGFVPLFDGKTLAGWRGNPALWSVEDGAITGKSATPIARNTFLIHGGNFTNFELRFKYRFLTPTGNSGLQYRSRIHPQSGEYSVAGYQANVVTPEANERFGFLYDEHARGVLAYLGESVEIAAGAAGGVERKVMDKLDHRPDFKQIVRDYPQWNEAVVIAYKNQLINAVNGYWLTRVTDEDAAGRAMDGFFALQLHGGPPMGVQFKDIEVRELAFMPNWMVRFNKLPTLAGVPAVAPAAAAPPIAEAIYTRRCAGCHSSQQPEVPPKAELARFSQSKIVEALTSGTMQTQALGLSAAEIAALAAYLTSAMAAQP